MARYPAAISAVVLASVLTGCATIPQSGPVVEGAPVREEDPQVYVGADVPPPSPGASGEAIVAGYLLAMAAYEPSYSTARKFLTPEAESTWDPHDRTTIYEAGSLTVHEETANLVVVGMSVVAMVSPAGGYVPAPAESTEQYNLRLRLEDGEWRIANPPPGLVISDGDFDSEFQPFFLYYFDPRQEVLVPDPLYLPVGAGAQGSLGTLLAERLLRGPSAWLDPAVRTAFPPGTQLGVESVSIENGQASVELSAEAADASAEQRGRMVAQLAWTLRQVRGVNRVAVTSDGVPLLPGPPTTSPVDAFGGYDPNLAADNDELYAIGESGVITVSDQSAVAGPLGEVGPAEELAIHPLTERGAVVDSTHTRLAWAQLADDSELETLVTGTMLTSPSWDRTDLIWVIDRIGDKSRLLVTTPGTKARKVTVSGLGDRTLERISISPDGTRVAVVASGDLMLGVIVRETDQPGDVHVEGLRRIALDSAALDVAWSGTTELAVLGSPEAGRGSRAGQATDEQEAAPDVQDVYVVELSGNKIKPAGQVRAADTLTAVDGVNGQRLVVGIAGARLLERDETLQWADVGAGKRPVYPG